MSENLKTEFPGRRNFIGKLSALGALSVSGSWSKPVGNESIIETELTESQANEQISGTTWPKLTFKKASTLCRENGPNLTNLFCRLDVPISGNLKHFQIMGSGGETQFIQAIHSTESYIFYKDQFYSLAESDEISFEYALTSISVSYKNEKFPFFITKKIFLPSNYACCIQHVSVKNTTTQPLEMYFVEKAKFTLGDPYYTLPAVQDSEYCTGFKATNELARNYSGKFLMSGKDVFKVWCRDDQIRYQMNTTKQPWKADQYIFRNCDDQSALLQKKLNVSGNSETDFSIYYSAGAASNETINGIKELSSLFQTDCFSQLETVLTKQAHQLAMIQTPDALLNQGFAISNKVSGQVFQSADGLVALPGHMYSNFYSRDSHWQIHGLLANGKFEQVKELLTHFIKYQNAEGSFPTRINLAGKPIYHTSAPDLDSAALIWLSLRLLPNFGLM